MFLNLPTEVFLKLLYIPITNIDDQKELEWLRLSLSYPALNQLVDKMTMIKNRIELKEVRNQFDDLRANNLIRTPVIKLQKFIDICDRNTNLHMDQYVLDLKSWIWTFEKLTASTRTPNQTSDACLLNSEVSNFIHDQGYYNFYSMLIINVFQIFII